MTSLSARDSHTAARHAYLIFLYEVWCQSMGGLVQQRLSTMLRTAEKRL
jgi:hypothetical protein